MGLDYEADKASIVDPATANAGLPMEIWHARDGVSSYPSMPEFLTAVAAMQGTGAKLNATYVYDIETGLKLFGKTAFWVKAGEDYATFLRKGEAEAYAAANGGSVITFDEAIADFVVEG
jgi:NitT/TauT family transport system substrate-binding protein